MAKKRSKSIVPDARHFYRVAVQRLEEAHFLFDHSTFTTACVYLSGYAVECALKAVLSANTPSRRRIALFDLFRGSRGHSFDWLQQQLNRSSVMLRDSIRRLLLRLDWSTELRYYTGRIAYEETDEFLDSVDVIVEWTKRSI